MSEINLVNSNNLKSTNESKVECLNKLSSQEKLLFMRFVCSVEGRTFFVMPSEVTNK